jgi:hypothetical protein
MLMFNESMCNVDDRYECVNIKLIVFGIFFANN